MKRKKIIAVAAVALAAVITVGTLAVIKFSSETDYLLLGKADTDTPEYLDEKLPETGETVLGTEGSYSLIYVAEPFEIRLVNNATGESFSTLSENGTENFLQIGCTDFSGKNDVFNLSDSEYSLACKALKNGVALGIYLKDYSLGITVELWLNSYGLKIRVPVDSIMEKGEWGIYNLSVFPTLGAADDNENGFIVYPDGSGSLYRFADKGTQSGPISTSFYFDSSFDLDSVDESIRQGEQYIMIPAFGISDGSSAVSGYVTEGDSNCYLTLSPKGFGGGLNRVYVSCMYRKSYSYTSPSGVEISETEKEISASDFAVQYFFTEDSGSILTYSDIAMLIREFMIEEKYLPEREISGNRVNIQLITGAMEDTGIGSSLKTLTTFEQVREIAEEFTKEQRESLRLYLLGWQSGGYGLNPSGDSVSGKLGGKSGLKELNEWLKEEKAECFLAVDYVAASSDGKGFNKNSQAVYNEMKQPISNSDYSEFLRNPLKELEKFVGKRLAYIKNLSAYGVAFEKSGYYLYDDYQSGRELTRTQAAAALSGLAAAALDESVSAAVQGGNAYMLKNASVLYDLPESNSGNSAMTCAIPFYQMIVHGSVPYCGTVPGNMASDYQTEKLKWIEYGSEPYFVLTYESADLMKNTYVTDAYATDYEQWIEAAAECAEEFSGKLAFTAGSVMVSHEYLSDDLVRVGYDNGSSIIINYSSEEQTADGVDVPAEDYVVIGGEN